MADDKKNIPEVDTPSETVMPTVENLAVLSLILTASALRWKKTRLAAAPLTVTLL